MRPQMAAHGLLPPQGGAADGGRGAALPGAEADDHQGSAEEIPGAAHGAQLRADGERAGTDPKAPQPREEGDRGQDALLPQGVMNGGHRMGGNGNPMGINGKRKVIGDKMHFFLKE